MDGWVWLVIAVAVVVIGFVAYGAWKAKRRSDVKNRFGPEYDRLSSEKGTRGAVSELSDREKRRDQLDIRPLNNASAERYRESWTQAQARFVDQPDVAIKEADSLVGSVMVERGYPMNDFDQRAADISVDHPKVVTNYRAAHTIAERAEHGDATTEELRQAMVHYRALFEELLETHDTQGHRYTDSSEREDPDSGYRPQR